MTFEQRVVEAIQPIRFHVLAAAIHHLFDRGIYDRLLDSPASFSELQETFNLDAHKSEGFFKYLANEDVLKFSPEKIELTEKGLRYNEARGWYALMIGGYMPTYMQIGSRLEKGSGWTDRDGRQVGIGSCQISRYDAIPMTQKLMSKIPHPVNCLLDVGCGSATYLIEFCKQFPQLNALGVEPNRGGYEAALAQVEKEGLSDRVRMFNTAALESIESPFGQDPDMAIVNYVLQEILSQDGEEAVIQFLTGIAKRFPNIYFIVIEVDNQIDNQERMKSGLALAGYNPYYLIHYFTNQRLETDAYWQKLFARCGLDLLAKETTDPEVDSTELEIGYLLKPKP